MKTAHRFLAAAATSFILVFTAGCSSSDDTNSEAAGHITRAETYADQGQYRSAMLEVRNAIQKDPGNVDHVLVLTGIYNSFGAGAQATELLEPWQEDHSDLVTLPLARGYILQGKHLSAREALDGFQPQNDSAQREYDYLKAESQRLAGNTGQALRQLRSLQESHPADAEITTALAKAMLASGEADAAVNTLNQWTEQNGENAEVLYLTGLAHYRMGNIDESTQVLTDATAAVPTSDIFLPVRRSILTLLSRSLTEQGRITEAQVYNKILAENTSSDTRERAESAIEAIQRGDLSTARTTLEELLQQNPDNERIAMMLGALSLQEGRTGDAEALLAGSIDAETTPTPFIRAATIAQIDSGKREEALTTLARAIEARPNDLELLAMHGILALSLPDHTDTGVASLSKALELDRSRSRLHLALARHYQQEGQTEQALAQMRVAFTETPTDWSVTQSYLALLLNTDRETEAKEVAESLINGFADEPQAVTLAAITEHRLGETEAARTRLEDQVEAMPENLPALAALATIYQSEGEYQKATDTLVEAALLQPANLNLLQAAGRAYAQEHAPGEVVSWLGQTAEIHEELATSSYILAAQILVQQGKLEEASELLVQVPEDQQTEQSETVKLQLLVAEAEQAARAENWSTARARAGEAASLRPENLNIALIPVRIAAAEGKHDEALATLDELEATHGEHAATDLARASLLASKSGNESAAFEHLDKRWQETENPALLPSLVNLAKRHSPANVAELTDAWVEASPENPAAHLRRAEHQMANGEDSEAIASYEAALGRQPDNAIALNNLAWLLRERDQQRAITLAEQARDLAPQSPPILDTYGWILHLAGRNKEAKPVLEEALALAPDSEEIKQHLETVNQAL
ncbi:tetratricopeptide repeat protein [Marinobacter bryozoorum]|uniref:tetratricopeptide repeat protein n=1 Tax=Marinobacter bryozoorum TaxID=256324 RepID=UPI00200364D1|nr:tetratricopeptide repeat protein [Marinobacter bryozoorum]MCK7546191.1 tetratricopeptide repeat protein [Marinobacter bryozoorum]